MIILAPLGGGPSTPELVAAVSNAGALGTLAGAYLAPDALAKAIAKTRTLTSRPFAINLFAPMPHVTLTGAQISRAIETTRPFRRELGLADPTEVKPPYHHDFDAQLAVVLEARPAAFSFVFGLVPPAAIAACRARGIETAGTATTPDEARELRALGVDKIVAQGVEAGGHRGTFSAAAADRGRRTDDLVRALAPDFDVIAAGGIMDGRDAARVLGLGAKAAMLGTAFLLCPEAGTSAPYRAALRRGGNTRLTRAFSGRLARGLVNRFMQEVEEPLPFPAQNSFTRDIRTAAAAAGKSEMLSLWAGEGLARIRELPAGELTDCLLKEVNN